VLRGVLAIDGSPDELADRSAYTLGLARKARVARLVDQDLQPPIEHVQTLAYLCMRTERNRGDLDDVPEDVREAMTFHPV